MSPNAGAGRNAAQFTVAEQENIARRIVALRVFADARWLFVPNEMVFFCYVRLPHGDICPRNSDDLAHSFGVCAELGMTQNAANKSSNLILPDDQTDKAIPHVAKIAIVEIQITREKSWTTQFKQERNYRVVR